MRWTCTKETIERGVPSALAIVETLAAFSLSVYIGMSTGTWWHMLASSAIAPLVLLRTNYSINSSYGIASEIVSFNSTKHRTKYMPLSFICILWLVTVAAIGIYIIFIEGHTDWKTVLLVVAALNVSMAFANFFPLFFGRFGGFVQGLIFRFRESIKAIPGNWQRAVTCVDFAHPPELFVIPDGQDELHSPLDSWVLPINVVQAWIYSKRKIRQSFYRDRSSGSWFPVKFIVDQAIIIMTFIYLFLGLGIIALLMRISVKSTVLIWLPVIWAAQPARPKADPLTPYLRLKISDDLPRLTAAVSVLVLLGFIVKYGAWAAGQELAMRAEAWHGPFGEQLGDFVAAFVRPGEIPLWQLASAINALLAIVLFGLVRHWIHRVDAGLTINEPRIERALAVLVPIRRLLSSYSIVVNIVVLFFVAKKLPLPPIGTKLFPWL